MEDTMAGKEIFETEKAAVLGGPYCQAVIHGGLIYISGQGPVDPETNMVCLGTIEEETAMTMENIRIILEESGSSLKKLLKLTVYLRKMKEYGRFNDAYRIYFSEDFPARSCVQAGGLPFGISVEIDAIAYV